MSTSSDVRKRSAEPRDRDLKDFIGAKKAEQISHLFDKVYPIFHMLGELFNRLWPFFLLAWTKANNLWIALQPYHPWDLSSVVVGFVMAFFGSRYLLLFAAIEAARQTGYKGFAENLAIIYDHFEEVYEHNLLDNAVDADKNGKADVTELSRRDLFTRKFKLLLRVTDPEVVLGAASGLWIAFLGIIATLRLQFAQTICLGVSIGAVLEGPLLKYAAPPIAAGVHSEYRQWVPFGVRQFCRMVGCSVAFLLTRLISGFYSAIKGAQLFSMGLIAYLVKYRYIDASHANHGLYYSAIVAVIFVVGFYFQLATFFSLPFPLNLLLLPATICENILMYFVSSSVQTGTQ